MKEVVPDLVPARMLNQFAYCNRLGYLEWAQSEFATSADVLEGHLAHKVANRETKEWQFEFPGTDKLSSLKLSSPVMGLIAVMDIVEREGKEVFPIEYKKGPVPDNLEKSWEPDRIQLAAQAIILRDNGFTCSKGVLYYVASKTRVNIEINEALIKKTLETKNSFLETVRNGNIPPPLDNSPKCIGCSLSGICLPDEIVFLKEEDKGRNKDTIRRLVPARTDALPMYVQVQGAFIGKDGEEIVVKVKGDIKQKVRLIDISQLSLFGNVQISTQALRELISRNISVAYFTMGGYFIGLTSGPSHKNVELRIEQFRTYFDDNKRLSLAKSFVMGKIKNSRRFLNRNLVEEEKSTLKELANLQKKAKDVTSIESLLGIEGIAAKIYFSSYASLLTQNTNFKLEERNRRPPKDPVNALLSYTYGLLAKDYTTTIQNVGLDPHLGFYHAPRYGRPALALDLMEEMRSIIADSVVLGIINRGEINIADFVITGLGVTMKDNARKKLLEAYERRLDTLINHPLFGYSISYRRVIEIQCRLLSRFLLGEINDYPPFTVR